MVDINNTSLIDGKPLTRKEQMRAEFEEHFYATWPSHIKAMSDQKLINLNKDRLQEVNSCYPETMLILKTWVLQEMAERGL